MPFTPYHFGPGAAIKAAIPGYFSLSVFGFAQIVTDFETAYYFIRGEYPLHRWLHTYLGASVVALFCVLVGRPLCQLLLRLWCRWKSAPFKHHFPSNDKIPLVSAITGAFLGTYSHVFLDSIMHADVAPFSPFAPYNPLYRVVSVITLHVLCLALGVLGIWRISVRLKN